MYIYIFFICWHSTSIILLILFTFYLNNCQIYKQTACAFPYNTVSINIIRNSSYVPVNALVLLTLSSTIIWCQNILIYIRVELHNNLNYPYSLNLITKLFMTATYVVWYVRKYDRNCILLFDITKLASLRTTILLKIVFCIKVRNLYIQSINNDSTAAF